MRNSLLSRLLSASDAQQTMSQLEADFKRSGNPVYISWALKVCRQASLQSPAWIIQYLTDKAEAIAPALQEAAQSNHSVREAQLVGGIMGFGGAGTGQPGRYKQAEQLERDRDIHRDIRRELDSRSNKGRAKLDQIYTDVAAARALSRSTVVRAYLRIEKSEYGWPARKRKA
jgi:hypothetical protein